MYPIELRYAWPSELDLMAQLAGLTRRGTLGRLGAAAVRRRQPEARVGLRSGLSEGSVAPNVERAATLARWTCKTFATGSLWWP